MAENGKGNKFEKKIDELSGIVSKLEGDVSLSESMELFQSGIALTKECIAELNEARKNIDALKGELDKILVDSDTE